MEILRIKKEEEEKRRQYSEEKERLMGRVGYQIPPEQPIQLKPDEKIPTWEGRLLSARSDVCKRGSS